MELPKALPMGKRLVVHEGGLVNSVPCDLLQCESEVTVAVDDIGTRTPHERPGGPPFFETFFTASQVIQQTILNEKLEQRRPDIYVRVPLRDITILDFHKVDEIYRQAAKAKAQRQWELERCLG
jgi:predicted acylesterase/phospholipase RssA